MKLSRLLRRKKYGSHREKIDLSEDQPGVSLKAWSAPTTDVKTLSYEASDNRINKVEAQSVREAFEAFKKARQMAEKSAL